MDKDQANEKLQRGWEKPHSLFLCPASQGTLRHQCITQKKLFSSRLQLLNKG
ncbi:hypothetical protein PB1_15449 [Bacillus methanolicus PB1]|uniref:Uncharacterized protein n=1 Tax=Bacillus methanolicus PB1 TaxID=997296 RepID=I3DXJ5_BACMT|nr:hypothetical protein PB1_15449 [Bacillus methanolicus PB1]